MEQKPLKLRLAQFGRQLALLCNRALMYRQDHPVVRQSVDDLRKDAAALFNDIAPIVFILNRDLFYVDEEPLDPRINVTRIAKWFKTNNIQSVSFEPGLKAAELAVFAGIFSQAKADDVQVLRDTLAKRGVAHIKLNHVVYKKVTEDDQVVSREALKKATPVFGEQDAQDRKRFMETLLESVLTEEFAKTLNINSLLSNPGQVSENMIAADLAGAAGEQTGDGTGGPGSAGQPGPGEPGEPSEMGGGADTQGGRGGGAGQAAGMDAAGAATGITGSGPGSGPGTGSGGSGTASGLAPGEGAGTAAPAAGEPGGSGVDGGPAGKPGGPGQGSAPGQGGHGHLLLQQLEMMQHEVQKHLQGQGDVDLGDLAAAVFDLKKQLLEGIEAQKALGVAYENEASILAQADQLTDQVLIELIKQEYQAGKITTSRLAYLIKRLIPEADELKRLLPLIKNALLGEGMAMDEYLKLLSELRTELQSDDLGRILKENLEAIGVDGAELINDIKADPQLAAKLMYMAGEIRKGGGNEAELTDYLVDYIETSVGQRLKEAGADADQDEARIKKAVTGLESDLLGQLSRLNVNQDALVRMEQRLNERMEDLMDSMRLEWLQSQGPGQQKGSTAPALEFSVLQTLENHVADDEELEDVLKIIRGLADDGEIDENNFAQIHAEINKQKQLLRERLYGNHALSEVLDSDALFEELEREIARCKRYGEPFCALGFTIVSAQIEQEAGDSSQDIGADQDGGIKVFEAALELLVDAIREVDCIGRIGKNKIVVVLPTLIRENGKQALDRLQRLLHSKPLDVDGNTVRVRVAGVVVEYDPQQTANATSFAKHLVNHLSDMANRLRNIQALV